MGGLGRLAEKALLEMLEFQWPQKYPAAKFQGATGESIPKGNQKNFKAVV